MNLLWSFDKSIIRQYIVLIFDFLQNWLEEEDFVSRRNPVGNSDNKWTSKFEVFV